MKKEKRICNKCQTPKSHDEFYKTKNGLRNTCIECYSDRSKWYYEEIIKGNVSIGKLWWNVKHEEIRIAS